MCLNYGKSCWSIVLLILFTSTAFAQSIVTGTVTNEVYEPVGNARVVVTDSGVSVSTDSEGMFSIEVPQGKGLLEIIHDSYGALQVPYTIREEGTKDLGNIMLSGNGVALEGIVVVGKGVIDLAEDRKTPIASTVVTADEIRAKAVGNVEFPEIMKNVPNVYVANQSGGFGEAQMFLRGFDQSNTAFLLNGQPINGMEDGKVYWSNWSGMSDIANAVDVQRGLGSSKLAISSVGGTVNIVTKATDRRQGGYAQFIVGNDSYLKGAIGYNTGLMSNGWGLSIGLSHNQAHRKWANGTAGAGQTYFLSIGKVLGDHNFNFLLTGAPQWHDQNFSKPLSDYAKYGRKYNGNYGYLNGEYLSLRRNYYHKPIMNLNWDWNISDKANLSTVLYSSFGRGGGTGPIGNGPGYNGFGVNKDNGLIDWDFLANTYNPSVKDLVNSGYNGTSIRASVNNHSWFGGVTNFEIDLNDELSLNVGGDVRFYKGDHFRQLTNLLGLKGRISPNAVRAQDYLVTDVFNPNPWDALTNFANESQRVAYDNTEWINYQGLFGQAEYANDMFSAFVQGAISRQSYKKQDRWNTAGLMSENIVRPGYNIKGGASFNINENNTVFANVGKYSRQPYLDNLFEYGSIVKRETEVKNEDITGIEAGYKAKWGVVNFNTNLYYTAWKNRFISADGRFKNGALNIRNAGFRIYNVDQIHRGVEMEVNTNVTRNWMVRSYFTYGDWKYDGKMKFEVVDTDKDVNNVIFSNEIDVAGIKVGEAPQVSFGMGTKVDFLKGFSWFADLNFSGKLYAFVKLEELSKSGTGSADYKAEKLNDFATVDSGLSYKFKFMGKQNLEIRANVYNLFNTMYVSRIDNYGYYFGNGRTWNSSIRYTF